MRRWKRMLCLCLALLLSLTLLPAEQARAKVTQEQIDELEGEAGEIAQRKKDLQAEIAALKNDKKDALAKKNKLDQQSDLIREEIQNTEKQIEKYNTLMAQTRAELAQTKEREATQYELFCQRVRAMEENGTVDYWAVLFAATDFTDMLGRLADINEVMEYDQGVMEALADLRLEIEATEALLEKQLAAEEVAKTKLEQQKSELDRQVKEAASLIAEIEEDQEGAQKLYEEEIAAAAKIEREIKEMEKKLALQNNPATYGGYIWPVASNYITSPYGSRLHPIYKVWRMHNGIDIGRVGYTTEVNAVKAGTVITSAYERSYGNYVVISHGSGNTSLYAHLSSRKVKAGATVRQGQLIGITGSTGGSTGPHLHFELREDNVRIDPLKYLTNYVKAW